MPDKELNQVFTANLLKWNSSKNNRAMPWKGEKDPYKIWLSEIILQQTRVEQGLEYYNRFVKTFPTVQMLAKAPEEKVFKLWEGLGYYSRCKNLISSAKLIAREHKGRFPDTYESILKLKGVGPYTASAIASFAYNLPHAVLDGNVFRVLSRFFGIKTPIDSNAGKQQFSSLANELLHKSKAGIYNQALMDFGATVCKPQNPLCSSCPMKKSCNALLHGTVNILPIKEKTIGKKVRWFYYLEACFKDIVYVRKRGAKDIWENLYEFILEERTAPAETADIQTGRLFKEITGARDLKLVNISTVYRQQLTHQTIIGQFIRIELKSPLQFPGYEAVPVKKLRELPFPKFIVNYLTEKKLTLNL